MEREGFVGRDHELGVLEARLAAAREGNGGVVLVDGEAGMGKTALADELVRRVRSAGTAAYWGSCLEGEGAAPYRPWTQILGAIGTPPDGLLAPGTGSRFRVFDEVVARLRAAADAAPMLLVLDDLHWADVPSLRLLQVLASEAGGCRLLAVGLHRIAADAQPATVLTAIARERSTGRLTLGGLAPAEIERLARSATPARPGAAVVRAVVRRAEGNPLFAVELTRLAALHAPAGRALPVGIRDTIARRLDQLPETTRGLLRQAAVLGRDFSPALLAELAGAPVSRVVELLDPALIAEVLAPGNGSAVRFGHVLTQELAYDELPGAERLTLIGLLGVHRSGAAGRGRFGAVGIWIAVIGWAGLAGCEARAIMLKDAAYPSPSTDVLEGYYELTTILIGIGMVMAGISVVRARSWTGWPRYVVLACGVAVFVLVIPGVIGPFLVGRLVLTAWMLMFAALGVALVRAPAR